MAHLILSFFSLLAATCGSLADDVVLLTGGWPKRILKSVEVFDETGCTVTTTLPDKRAGHTSNYVSGRLLICGGMYTKTSCLQLVDGEFRSHSHFTEDRWCHSGVALNGKLSLMGGHGSQWNMEILTGTRWDRYWPMRHNVDDSCVVTLDKRRIMFIGGLVNSDAVSMYDGHRGWTRKTNLPVGRSGHSCVVLENGSVLVAGGWEGAFSKILNTAVIYNGQVWEELPGKLTIARAWGQMVKVNGNIWFFGGRNNANKDLESVEEFDEENLTWKRLSQTMKTPRSYFSAVVVPASEVGCRS